MTRRHVSIFGFVPISRFLFALSNSEIHRVCQCKKVLHLISFFFSFTPFFLFFFCRRETKCNNYLRHGSAFTAAAETIFKSKNVGFFVSSQFLLLQFAFKLIIHSKLKRKREREGKREERKKGMVTERRKNKRVLLSFN